MRKGDQVTHGEHGVGTVTKIDTMGSGLALVKFDGGEWWLPLDTLELWQPFETLTTVAIEHSAPGFQPNDWVYHQEFGVALVVTVLADTTPTRVVIDCGSIQTVDSTELSAVAWDAWSAADLARYRVYADKGVEA